MHGHRWMGRNPMLSRLFASPRSVDDRSGAPGRASNKQQLLSLDSSIDLSPLLPRHKKLPLPSVPPSRPHDGTDASTKKLVSVVSVSMNLSPPAASMEDGSPLSLPTLNFWLILFHDTFGRLWIVSRVPSCVRIYDKMASFFATPHQTMKVNPKANSKFSFEGGRR